MFLMKNSILYQIRQKASKTYEITGPKLFYNYKKTKEIKITPSF